MRDQRDQSVRFHSSGLGVPARLPVMTLVVAQALIQLVTNDGVQYDAPWEHNR